MTISFILYLKNINPASIEATGTASDEDLALLQETNEIGVIVLKDDDGEVTEATHMIQDGEITLKPTHNTTVNVSGNIVTLSNLPPEPYELFIDMGEGIGLLPVTETEFELTDPGEYTIVIRPGFPYLEENHSVEII